MPSIWSVRGVPDGLQKSAYCEIQRHKAGWSARRAGTVEVIAGPAAVDFTGDPQ